MREAGTGADGAAAAPSRMRSSALTALMVAGAVALALFGSFLLVLTPSLGDRPGLQTLWVLFSLVLLKVPLLGLVWWIIVRRRARRGERSWTAADADAFVARLDAAAAAAEGAPDEDARRAALRAEAWAAVDRAGETNAPPLVALALRLDRDARRAGRD